jgi:beta-mannosidase
MPWSKGDATAVRFELFGPDGALLHSADVPVEDGMAAYTFTVASPALWWPRSHGGQPVQRLAATASTDRRELRLGLRRLRLVQEPLDGAAGASFFVEVNNTPIYCGGAN